MDFDIHIMEGAGAFVCGEETALIASMEGRRGMPKPKPPFPAQNGLFGKPTVINNVETLASVPVILSMGPGKYATMGTAGSKGTKTFALTGNVAHTGLIEVPFGSTLREIVVDIGGGVIDNDGNNVGPDFKAVQIGGPSGGCLTQEHLDMPLDYETLTAIGAMVGSGGLVVMNQQTCMVQIARFFMQFTQNESCGKCVVCREGTRQMLNLLDDIIQGEATEDTLALLEELAHTVKIGSLCGLGKTAPNPILSTLRYFRKEYEDHVLRHHCPAGVCKAFLSYKVVSSLCKSCGLCAKKCPVNAISGEKGVPYVIDGERCIQCGACMDACKFHAVVLG
jgi:NADH-quinone oxidoreductase subunit F